MKVQIDNKWYQTISQQEMPAYLKRCRELNKLAIPKVYKDSNGKHNVYEILEQENVKITFDDIKANLLISTLKGESIKPEKVEFFKVLNLNSTIYQYCDTCGDEKPHVKLTNKVACKTCCTAYNVQRIGRA